MSNILTIVIFLIHMVIFFVLFYIGKEKKKRLRVSIALFFFGGLLGPALFLIGIGVDYPGFWVVSSFSALLLGTIFVVFPNLYWWSQDKYWNTPPPSSKKRQ